MIQIKRNNNVFFTLEDFGEGSKLSYQLMDHHYIILKFTTATPVYFEIGDSVEIPDFGYFELTSSYFPKHNDSDGYDYEMQMDAYYMSWKNKLCKYRPQHGANETSFKLTTTVGVHMNVILGNLKALGLTYNGKEFSVDYTTYNNKAFDVQKRFLIEYGSISILDALNSICSEDALNCEWWIDGSIIYLGYCEMEGQTTFEQDVNVLSMSYSESKSTYITRLYAFGSDRNIPKGYFTGADADVTTDGVATDYLMLPNKEVDSDGFYAKDGYLENVNVVKNDKQAIEGVVMFDDEYPKVESVVSGIKTYDSTVDNDDDTKTTQTFWQVTATDSFATSFEASWIKSNLTLGIKFTSGALMGMEFDVSFKIIDKVNYFEIVANDTYGRTLPDGVMCPKVGDKFFLFNWDATKITDTDLIPTAQLSLFDRAKQYYQKTMISNSNFTCTMDGDKFYNDGTYDYHPLGEQVKLINDMFAQVDADGKHYRNSRIIGMEIPLDIPYDHPQYMVGEKAATSRLGKLEDKVDSIKVNGMQIGGTGNGNGGGVYVIGMNDTTSPSDSNVFSARRSRMEFLSRLQDSTAKGTITWEKIQKLLSGLFVGNSNSENGGSWTPDAEGRSHLITDYLEVRMKAIFEELAIKKNSTIGGKEIISPAGGVAAYKVDEVTVTYNDVSQKAYRCYFLAEQDGDKIDNDFVVEDQVRSESFNLNAGKYHKTGNHFFWRLVVGIDEEPVELDGKKYHYIDLSETDCATGSDVPMKGDVLSQCGNRSDPMRQSCLVFSAVDTYSPSVTLYHGVNGYTFNNKEYVDYGVNHSTGKAFFHVYGDMYFGDRPTSANNYEGDSYVKYDSDKKKVTIKGDLDIKSTYDGKTLDKYIADNSLDKNAVETIIKKSETITDLKNQIDGAIETWFYDGVPTLKNEPAVGWTDNEKKIHLGDLYYDNLTGKAYRFAKDGSIYKWTIIKDTELTKALEDSSQALKDAKSKRRIFGSQPVPPYDVNDMWVNATYPSDGSTYKNEILKCSTSKAEGEEFDISDWELASKYTDDTKAEEAKKAAEKAQAEIKDTQTNLIALGTTVSNNKKAFDAFTSDGYLDSSEIAAIAQDSKRLEDDYNAAVESYNNVVGSKFLLDKDGNETTYKTDLVSAKSTLDSAKNELITYLSDIVSRYNASDYNGKATIKAAAAQKYTNFTNAYKAFYDKLGVANNYITSNLFDGLNTKLITNMAGLEYIKAALVDGDTVVKGGLILSTLIALRNDKGNVTAGINGADTKENGIALWLGGKAIDRQASTTKEDEMDSAAKSLLRFDGTGYFANGNLWWDADGTLHADPTSFIINKNNIGVQLALFAPVWKSGTTDTTKLANVLSIDPQKPFTHLDVSGNVTTEGSLKIGGIYLSYDSANNALRLSKDAAGKEAANFYALGGITAYGAGASTTGGGGGLNGSVKSYSNALKLTSESLSEIASAYSIKALDSRISSLEGGSAMDVSVSGSGNAVTAISKSGTTISVTKGTTFLTSHQSLASYLTKTDAASLYQPKGNYLTAHQSLDGYVNAIAVSGSGNAVTAVTKSGKTITFTKGATFLTSHQSLAAYLTKSEASSTYQPKGNYLTSHQSLAAYATQNWVKNEATAYNADMVDNYHASGLFTDFSISDVANKVTISIGGTSKALNLVRAFPSGVGNNFNDIATHGNSMGMSNIAAPYASSTANHQTLNGYVNPNGQTGWHHYINLSYTDSNNTATSPNMWQTQFAIKAGTTEVYVRSRAGGKISNSNAWAAPWVRLARVTDNVASASKVANALSWSGYSSGSYNGSAAKSISIPNNTNQLTNGAGFITSSASISGNAATATNADKLDGIHANGLLTAISNSDKGISITVGGTTKSVSNISVNYASSAGNADTVDGYHVNGSNVAPYGHIPSIEADGVMEVGKYIDFHNDNSGKHDFSTRLQTTGNYGNSVSLPSASGTLALISDNVASATKLQTARTIWGQSFDGTGNVNGTIYINNNSSNGAIRLNNDVNSNARISAIDNQVIFNTGAAIRFGETAWDWNNWAGLKYTHSNKTIYLGIAENSAFNANSAQSDGILRLAGIKTITPDSGARIGNTGGDLYLGNSNNSAWVKVQDMTSQADINNWRIYQNGTAIFKGLTLNGNANFNGINVFNDGVNLNGYVYNRGIMPASKEVNSKDINCYVWGDALCSGITAITDSIFVHQVTIQYSNNNGSSWTNYEMSENNKFKIYANVAENYNIILGHNLISGNTDAEKLAQIKKNELLVQFYISNSCYSQPYFASVDITNGVNVICTVEILDKNGAVTESYTKTITGWSEINYINMCVNPNSPYGVGNDSRRYIRFRFKHDQNTKELRNAKINRIRIFSFTKYSYPTDRFMGHTGHIYNFDYNMNTYFPNSILAKGGVTAYQSSDVRLKTNITKLNCLNVIKSIGGTYEFDYLRDHKHSIGFIAQHVNNPLLKDIIAKDKDGYLKINYWSPKLISLAFGALTEIDNEVDKLKSRVRELETEVEYLKNKDYAIQ